MRGPRLKKSFGQHHLTRSDLCLPLLEYLEPAGRRVVEVGPGGGVLTGPLLESGAAVLALELDPEWAFPLHESRSDERLRLAVVDAMRIAWDRVPAGTLITGNLPYEIGSALIRALLPLHERIPRMAFLIQREVAERFVAPPSTGPYGLLSVLAAAWSEPRFLGSVARGSFRPPPKVEGAFVGFELAPPPLEESGMADFVKTVETAFGLRRKTVRNALAASWGRQLAEETLNAAGVDTSRRAETLALDDFVRIERARASLVGGGPRASESVRFAGSDPSGTIRTE